MKTFLLTFCAAFLALAFSVKVNAQVPTITTFSPDSGPIGSTVVITGTNFSPVAENNVVYIGRVKAVVTAASATSLAVIVPAGALQQPLSVTVNGLTAYSSTPFVVTFPCSNPTLSFARTNSIVVGSPLADIDGDGKVDFVVGKAPDSLSILRNLSVGDAIAFAPGVAFQTGGTYDRIVDWDGDGKLDLAVVDTASKTFSLLRNTSSIGNISFAPKVDVPFTGSPTIVDWDGDGKLDLAVVNSASNTFSLLRNTSSIGNISFAPKVDVPVPGTVSLSIRDLNGDGKPDLYSIQTVVGVGGGTLSVYLNISTEGTLAFANKVDFPIQVRPKQVDVADFDGDGKPDFGFLDQSFSVLRNTSTGGAVSFEGAGHYSTAFNPCCLTIVDLDKDGKPDLLTYGGVGSSYVSTVLRNTSTPGTISFASGQSDRADIYSPERNIRDLTGDGKPELVVQRLTGDQCSKDSTIVSIYQNTSTAGSLSFRNAQRFSFAGCFGAFIGPIVDLNGDGKSDMVINGFVYRNETVCSPCTVPTFKNDGTIALNPTCSNSDGNITIQPTSGTAPFMYSINGGTTYVSGPNAGLTFLNLAAGTYQLRLKDANGCESAVVQRVLASTNCPTCTPPTFKNDGTIVLDASCGNNDGNITIQPTSGTAPFMYSINGGSTYVSGPNAGFTFLNLGAGTYNLRLKDANGCESAIVEKTIRSVYGGPTFLNNGQIVLDASCGNSDGNITIMPTSGTAPFMYSINGGTTYVPGANTGYTFSNLAAGTYRLRLKDAAGCESAIVERTVRNFYNCPGAITGNNPGLNSKVSAAAIESNKDVITTFPNPNKGQFKVLLQNFAAPGAEVLVVDAKGAIIQKRSLNLNQNTITDFDLKGKARGMYYIRVVSSNGTKVAKVLIQ